MKHTFEYLVWLLKWLIILGEIQGLSWQSFMVIRNTYPNHGHSSVFFLVFSWWIINEFENHFETASLMQMYYKSCVHSRTIKVHELLCCINGYVMRIEGKKFEFEDTIVWVFVMHSSVEMVTKKLYLQIGAQKKARFFSLMYFCESLCINRMSHNYVIPQLVFCIIMPFRTSFHIPFRKLIPPFTLTGVTVYVFL